MDGRDDAHWEHHRRWLAALPFCLAGVLYAESLVGLVRQWTEDANYSHGFLVPVYSALLIWQRRAGLEKLELHGSWLGLPILAAGLAVLILGTLGAELFLTRSSMLVVIVGLVTLHFGTAHLRYIGFPLGFLFFMIPLPYVVFSAIAFPLQQLAAANASWTLQELGVPVLRDGNVIHLSRLTLGVAEACSGIRSLISLFALAVGWGYSSLSGPGMLALALFVVPLTVGANALRIVATGLIGQSFGIEYAEGFFHGFSGWLVFMAALVALVAIERGLRRILPAARSAS